MKPTMIEMLAAAQAKANGWKPTYSMRMTMQTVDAVQATLFVIPSLPTASCDHQGCDVDTQLTLSDTYESTCGRCGSVVPDFGWPAMEVAR